MSSDSFNEKAVGDNMLVGIEVRPEDADRLLAAFAEGRLAELGVLDVRVVERGPNDSRWMNKTAPQQTPGGLSSKSR